MNTKIGRVQIIAEIGTAHNGNIERAKQLIDAAKKAGADWAKFQIVYAHEILHPNTGTVNLPGGAIRLFDRFKELEVAPSFYKEIKEYCDSVQIGFLCSPFGIRSARELHSLSPKYIKIASPELNHFPLLKEVASYGLPLILSTGVSLLCDIEKALFITKNAPERILLHCITQYPAPVSEYNLSLIENLSRIFGVKTGISDHSMDPVLVPVLSAACGACMIEKHICLSRQDSGLDDPVALPPDLFAQMVSAVRATEGQSKETVISDMKITFGQEEIEKILGDGVKRLADSEKDNYLRTNRSLHFMDSYKMGEVIDETKIDILRTEKILNPGISPEFYEDVLGAVLTRGVSSGEGVSWEDLIPNQRLV